ncbi:MAG: hypothetical protein JNM67_06915 [Bacteroidetes bacterium]|nr:hypothetical protein [Bacteroidota bacterium]
MISQQNEHPLKAHSYFIESEGIDKIQTLFGPGTLESNNKQVALALELALYGLFGSFIFLMIVLPTQAVAIQNLFPNTQLNDPVGMMIWIKMTLFIASLVPLFWALHQSSKRLKGRLFLRKYKA